MKVVNSSKVFTPIAMAVACAIASANVSANDTKAKTEENVLEKITIVGATTNAVISPEALENYQANDLEDIFRSTPAVTVGGSLGIAQKIYVRGLEDSMVNVTVDGAPQTSTLFHHIGRVAIEPELLRSVEVQAGAGEATSGSGAIGGAIRFKTKTAQDMLKGDEKFGGLVKANYFSNSGHKQSVSLYAHLTDDVSVLASYVNASRDSMKDGDGKVLKGTAADQSLAFVKLNAELTDNQSVTLSYENRQEEGEFVKQTNWAPLENAPLFQSWGERETMVLNHAWYLSDLVKLETSLYQTESSFKRELFTWDASIKTTGFDIRNTSELAEHSITYGIEQKNDRVNAHSYEDFGGISDEDGKVTGIYAQDHWQITDELLLSFGLRYDAYQLDHTAEEASWVKVNGKWIVETDSNGNPMTSKKSFSIKKQEGFSKNLGLKYSFTDSLSLSAGYAEALRGRQVADAFTAGEIKMVNEKLAPEEVENTEIGLEYNDGTWLLEASVYKSVINDVVFDKFKGREGVFYENIGDLQSQGVELMAGYQGDNFDVLVSYNKNDVELNNTSFIWPDAASENGMKKVVLNGVDLAAYEYGGLGNAVGDSININVNYTLNEQINAGFNFNHVSDLNNIDVFHRSLELQWVSELETINKQGYQVLDAFVRYQPTEQLHFALTVQNLLDESYRNHGSVGDYSHIAGYEVVKGIKESGRDIRLSVSYQF